ncbi:GTPase RsgA [Galbibacter marinus]|uniref:Small ribosomal subunit biogenesis GTPase RsgA n=1 Tax=Galbibacter marinus TaxID=555500 RepID=K2PSA1_9FLAO|nr:ribosome small subunit-dependent GTPase A [Galbibacter marinus]EKF54394.1 GTPase RsgA [Galbibacter marinus]
MKGTVYKSTGSWYYVKAQDGSFINCRIKGRFRIQGIKSTNPVAVGDVVEFEIQDKAGEQVGVITDIHDRKNYIVRKSVNLSKRTHIIAANVDLAFMLVTLKDPVTFTDFIDRFLVTCEAYHVTPILVFNKIDQYTKQELVLVKNLIALYSDIGYQTIEVSAATGKNVEELKSMIKGKTSIFSGHSGVGKSTLVNALEPGLNLKTAEISQQHKQGQHTTTFAEMFDLSFSGQIIDTPGIKGFGIVDMENSEIGDYFPEFFAIKGDCKFHNCLHLDEPKCAVKQAVEQGTVAWSRYKSYLQIIQGEDENYRTDLYAE